MMSEAAENKWATKAREDWAKLVDEGFDVPSETQIHWRRPQEIWVIQDAHSGWFWGAHDNEYTPTFVALDSMLFPSMEDAINHIASLKYEGAISPSCNFYPVLIGVAPTGAPESILPRIKPPYHGAKTQGHMTPPPREMNDE